MTASPRRQIPKFITFSEAAPLLSPTATERTLRTYRERNWLRACKVGRVWHTTAEEIDALRERIWQQGSGSTDQITGTALPPSPDSPRTAGTSSTDSRTSAEPGRNASAQQAVALSSALEDSVLDLLEKAGFSTEASDQILELIHAEEVRLADKNYDDDCGGSGDPMHDVECPFAKDH